jgi:AbrB family looped-hinge helix DNA binding protein
MQSVTVSSKFQVVLPRIIRKSLDLHPGQKIQVFLYNNRIEMVPVKPIKEARGFLKGIDTTVTREKDRIWILSIRPDGWSILLRELMSTFLLL